MDVREKCRATILGGSYEQQKSPENMLFSPGTTEYRSLPFLDTGAERDPPKRLLGGRKD